MTYPTPYLPDWEWQLLTSAGTYLCGLGSATSRSLSFPLDGPATAQFTMADQDPNTAYIKEFATDLLVARTPLGGSAKTLFRGRITASTETLAADSETLQVTATDYRGMLDYRLLWPGTLADYTGGIALDPAVIAWELIQSNQNLYGDFDLGIRQGAGSTGLTTNLLKFAYGTTVGSAVAQIADAGNTGAGYMGFDWEVDVNLMFNVYHPQRGADHGVVLVYGPDIVSVTFTVTPDGYANSLYMTGTKPTTPVAVPDPSVAFPSGFGAWQQQKSDSKQDLQAALAAEAQGWLTTLSQVVSAGTVVLVAGRWDPTTAWVGDTVHITVPVGRNPWANHPIRVQQIDVSLDDNGVEQVSLTVGLSPPKLSQRFATIDKRVSAVELAPKGHVLAHAENVVGPSMAWFIVVGYNAPNDTAHNLRYYRCQVHINVPTAGAKVAVQVQFVDSGGTQTMAVVPQEELAGGVWAPPSVQFHALQGQAIAIEAYSDNIATTVSGQIESV